MEEWKEHLALPLFHPSSIHKNLMIIWPNAAKNSQLVSFPRSAWERRPDAPRPRLLWMQSVQDVLPRGAWEREGLVKK